MTRYVGRFAPSPTGPLHAGSLVAAVASYLQARARNGLWLLRIEDIDPPREVAGASEAIIQTLERFGFRWDGDIRFQSKRIEHYRRRLDEIATHTFHCQCSRRDVQTAQARMNISRDRYPGTCRRLGLTSGNLRFALDTPAAFDDLGVGAVPAASGPDDFVLWRRDDLPSYQWAVSVDDAEQGVTEVVRGADLLQTTPRQIALMRALGAPVPDFFHVPLVVNAQGQKLSKQTGAAALPPGDEAKTLCAAFSALGLRLQMRQSGGSLSDLWSMAIREWTPRLLMPNKKIPAF